MTKAPLCPHAVGWGERCCYSTACYAVYDVDTSGDHLVDIDAKERRPYFIRVRQHVDGVTSTVDAQVDIVSPPVAPRARQSGHLELRVFFFDQSDGIIVLLDVPRISALHFLDPCFEEFPRDLHLGFRGHEAAGLLVPLTDSRVSGPKLLR